MRHHSRSALGHRMVRPRAEQPRARTKLLEGRRLMHPPNTPQLPSSLPADFLQSCCGKTVSRALCPLQAPLCL
jgi:hypothetical protein